MSSEEHLSLKEMDDSLELELLAKVFELGLLVRFE